MMSPADLTDGADFFVFVQVLIFLNKMRLGRIDPVIHYSIICAISGNKKGPAFADPFIFNLFFLVLKWVLMVLMPVSKRACLRDAS